MKKIVLFVALFSVLVIFMGCGAVFNLNSNSLSVAEGTNVDLNTNSLTASEPIISEFAETESVVTGLAETEPADESIGGFFRELPLYKLVFLFCVMVLCCGVICPILSIFYLDSVFFLNDI